MPRIEAVKAIPIAYPEPNDNGAIRNLCLVRVTTDGGLVGWGEAVTMWPEATRATADIVDGLAELLIGRSVTENEALWREMRAHTWWYGHGGGLSSFAIAALDIALWDLKGKALDTPLVDLLGGAVRERLPAIASCHAFKPTIEELADEARDWVESGYQGVKVGFGKRGDARLGVDHERDVAYVEALRHAVGPTASIMIDVGVTVQWDLATATRRAHAFEEYTVDWLEEPLGGWDPQGYAELKAKTTVKIAYGEREWRPSGYQRLLDTGTVDVVGVDPGRAEGVSGFRRVAELVDLSGRTVNAHAWSSPIVTAASLAVSFSTPACRLFECKPIANPIQDDMVASPIHPVDGWMRPLEKPGLGIDIDEAIVEQYAEVFSNGGVHP